VDPILPAVLDEPEAPTPVPVWVPEVAERAVEA